MDIKWTDIAWEDYLYWQLKDTKILNKVNDLIKDIKRNGYKGIGKPEPLKHNLSGYWSRRIDAENRLVYKIQDDVVIVTQCRSHYSKD